MEVILKHLHIDLFFALSLTVGLHAHQNQLKSVLIWLTLSAGSLPHVYLINITPPLPHLFFFLFNPSH